MMLRRSTKLFTSTRRVATLGRSLAIWQNHTYDPRQEQVAAAEAKIIEEFSQKSDQHEIGSKQILFESPNFVVEKTPKELTKTKQSDTIFIKRKLGVVVIPQTREGDLILLKKQRDAVMDDEPLLELPSGVVENGETPRQAAARCLREEIGIEAGRLDPLCMFYINPEISTEKMIAYVAVDLQRAHAEQTLLKQDAVKEAMEAAEAGKPIADYDAQDFTKYQLQQIQLSTFEKLRLHLEDGRFMDAKTQAALGQFVLIRTLYEKEDSIQGKKWRLMMSGLVIGVNIGLLAAFIYSL